jgi:hypothetical protein
MRREMNDAHPTAPSWLLLLDAFARHAAALIRSVPDLRFARKENSATPCFYLGAQPSVRYSEQLLGNIS